MIKPSDRTHYAMILDIKTNQVSSGHTCMICIHISTPHGSGLSRTVLLEILGPGGGLFKFGNLFMHKTVLGSAAGDGPQQAGLNTAIESFWRCILVELWPFLLDAIYRSIRSHWRSPGVPGASPGVQGASLGGLRDVPWGPRGVHGGPRGIPWSPRRVSMGSWGSQGAPATSWASPGSFFHTGDSVI